MLAVPGVELWLTLISAEYTERAELPRWSRCSRRAEKRARLPLRLSVGMRIRRQAQGHRKIMIYTTVPTIFFYRDEIAFPTSQKKIYIYI